MTSQFYGVSGHNTASTELIIGGTQDNGTVRILNDSDNGAYVIYGDGGHSFVDPTDHNYCYGVYPGAQVFRSTNCATSGPYHEPIWSDIDDAPGHASFISPMILDPNNHERLVVGASSVWRTNTVRATPTPAWTEIKVNALYYPTPSPSATASPAPYKPIRITAVAIAPSNSNVIWVAENVVKDEDNSIPDNDMGRLYKTNNGASPQPTWTPVDENSTTHDPLPDRTITRIVFSPTNANTVYVAFGGFGVDGTDNLWRGTITDTGTNWENITGPDPSQTPGGGGLPHVPIRGFARHPTNANKLYVGTEIGVYVSETGGPPWLPSMEGPVDVAVDELVFMRGHNQTKLLAATHGRGIWVTDVDSPANGNVAPNDFDGDGRSDIAVVRHPPSPSPSAMPASSTWHLRESNEGYSTYQWGSPNDQIVPDDYDGDGKADITVFRESNGTWYSVSSQTGAFITTSYGTSGDIAVPGHFDSDNKVDEAVFRPSEGNWYINRSIGGPYTQPWGMATDVPVAEDFDGDGLDDIAVFRLKGTNLWYLLVGNSEQEIQFGLDGDIPVAGDYDGGGKADIALWRPSDGYWYLTYAEENFSTYGYVPWGTQDDVPVPGDYDGDGKYDIAFWRPSDGNWYLRQSTNGQHIVHFGANGDKPVGRKTEDGINNRPGAPSEIRRTPPSWARPQRRAPA